MMIAVVAVSVGTLESEASGICDNLAETNTHTLRKGEDF